MWTVLVLSQRLFSIPDGWIAVSYHGFAINAGSQTVRTWTLEVQQTCNQSKSSPLMRILEACWSILSCEPLDPSPIHTPLQAKLRAATALGLPGFTIVMPL
jgi:hypothetical protein